MDNKERNTDLLNAFPRDLNNVLCSFEDDPNNELRTYSDSPYLDTEGFISYLAKNTKSFSILSLNVQTLNSKFDEITTLLAQLENKNVQLSAICLQETWLSQNADTSTFNIDGYHLIHSGKSCSECGGLMIYLRNTFNYIVKKMFNNSKLWEGLFIDVQGGSLESKIIFGNNYRPPKHNNNNSTIENFVSELSPVIGNIANNNLNVAICGDFNIVCYR